MRVFGRRWGRREGNVILEAALMLPVIILLLVGMGQIAKITYTYYNLRKTIYSIGSYLSAQQGTNFCDPADPNVQQAISFGLTGSTDNSLPVSITGLTADMISIAPQVVDSATGAIIPCECSVSGCDLAAGGSAPGYIVISIPNGYMITPRIPFLPLLPIPLKPQVKVPYGGT
jgi:hypothetical protein